MTLTTLPPFQSSSPEQRPQSKANHEHQELNQPLPTQLCTCALGKAWTALSHNVEAGAAELQGAGAFQLLLALPISLLVKINNALYLRVLTTVPDQRTLEELKGSRASTRAPSCLCQPSTALWRPLLDALAPQVSTFQS